MLVDSVSIIYFVVIISARKHTMIQGNNCVTHKFGHVPRHGIHGSMVSWSCMVLVPKLLSKHKHKTSSTSCEVH